MQVAKAIDLSPITLAFLPAPASLAGPAEEEVMVRVGGGKGGEDRIRIAVLQEATQVRVEVGASLSAIRTSLSTTSLAALGAAARLAAARPPFSVPPPSPGAPARNSGVTCHPYTLLPNFQPPAPKT